MKLACDGFGMNAETPDSGDIGLKSWGGTFGAMAILLGEDFSSFLIGFWSLIMYQRKPNMKAKEAKTPITTPATFDEDFRFEELLVFPSWAVGVGSRRHWFVHC